MASFLHFKRRVIPFLFFFALLLYKIIEIFQEYLWIIFNKCFFSTNHYCFFICNYIIKLVELIKLIKMKIRSAKFLSLLLDRCASDFLMDEVSRKLSMPWHDWGQILIQMNYSSDVAHLCGVCTLTKLAAWSINVDQKMKIVNLIHSSNPIANSMICQVTRQFVIGAWVLRMLDMYNEWWCVDGNSLTNLILSFPLPLWKFQRIKKRSLPPRLHLQLQILRLPTNK